MEKCYLGISLGFNSSASLISNVRGVICSISQERLNLEKNTKQLPIDAMIACCSMAREDNEPLSVHLAYTHYEELSLKYIDKNVPEEYRSDWYRCSPRGGDQSTLGVERMFYSFLRLVLSRHNVTVIDRYSAIHTNTPLLRVEHHVAHEYSCYPVYGAGPRWIVLTSDGFGDGYSGRITAFDENNKEGRVISQVRLVDSPALVYQFFTGAMGFKEHQHEGKLTGLAAHGAISLRPALMELLTGDPNLHAPSDKPSIIEDTENGTFEWFDSGYSVDWERLDKLDDEENKQVIESTIYDFDHFLRLKKTIYRFVKDLLGPSYDKKKIVDWLADPSSVPTDAKLAPWNVAYTVQEFAESVTLNWLRCIPPEYKGYDLYLAGGLFANVKLNQKIKDTEFFSNVFVSPPMGDEGGALGAASYAMTHDGGSIELGRVGPEIVISAAVHNSYDCAMKRAIEMAVEDQRAGKIEIIGYDTDEMVAAELAGMLSNNEIVHWRRGRGEFGPRALGGSQSFYTALDPDGTKTLNHALGRDEFMPYAPCVLARNLDELFIGHERVADSLKYMTMTLIAKPGVKEIYKGVIHVDNTARPQVIHPENECTKHLEYLLDEYEKKTGLKMLILTSYNAHGKPTVCLADDAYLTWRNSNYIGTCLVIDRTMFLKVLA